jgi:MerR family transcriptional regulator, thiopeptide resistance regulator
MDDYTVGTVAELTGVSVRTLHHYDEIGLLEPSGRNTAGYRLYAPEELRRLQRILFYRELGFGLDAIAGILADPASTDGDHLERQRGLLADRIARLTAMLTAVERELAARAAGVSLTAEERLEVFGGTRLEDRSGQAEQRWGDTEEWAERRRRTADYTKEDWLALRTEQAGIHQRLLDAMRSGVPATDPAAMDLAEEHRLHIARRFHDCDHEAHRALAASYLAGERLGRDFDDMAPGLSQYVHDAIIANARRAESGGAQPASR